MKLMANIGMRRIEEMRASIVNSWMHNMLWRNNWLACATAMGMQ